MTKIKVINQYIPVSALKRLTAQILVFFLSSKWRILGVMAFQITGNSTVCFTVQAYNEEDTKAPHYWRFAINASVTGGFPTKGFAMRRAFSCRPQCIVAYINTNVAILFEFPTDTPLTNHKVELSESVSNRQNLDRFVKALCDQNNRTMGAEPRVRRALTRRHNHLLINSWFLSDSVMKFNDIFHKNKTALFWFDDIIFVPLILTEILHFSGISSRGRNLGTSLYCTSVVIV